MYIFKNTLILTPYIDTHIDTYIWKHSRSPSNSMSEVDVVGGGSDSRVSPRQLQLFLHKKALELEKRVGQVSFEDVETEVRSCFYSIRCFTVCDDIYITLCFPFLFFHHISPTPSLIYTARYWHHTICVCHFFEHLAWSIVEVRLRLTASTACEKFELYLSRRLLWCFGISF